ncbi:Hypothetical protein R9X50_00497100 [Acrodontium crateriforme]|uniref:Prion-inhibition and propagation HeLo domain-containing protein n=1 Tax=Acrodontium crateriforme TaxID=150365 RepID=A0AAQ3RAJ6_9PEZI|nr:Hypothetical protein R9X50_00497100 [Acrodontium crateriforme]
MAGTNHKAGIEHVEGSPAHEAALTSAVALANLFSNCVEAFGLIHPSHKWDKQEQLLLSRLGLQQARLLIWGDMVGISSPPKSVTDRAVPKHPNATYPDLKEPTFFLSRDGRLDDTETRMQVESALSTLVDRSIYQTREEMMTKYGLKPPKKQMPHYEPPLDINRLEAFREKYELLQEVCETYAQLSTRRGNSIVQSSWTIADPVKFTNFVLLTQEKVDFLIGLFGNSDAVDRGMRMDIRAFGWHLSIDRTRTAMDTSKLRLIAEACGSEYPQYVEATKEALANINRESRENGLVPGAIMSPQYAHYAIAGYAPAGVSNTQDVKPATSNGNGASKSGGKQKRPNLFSGIQKIFRKSFDNVNKARPQSIAVPEPTPEEPERSHSDSGPSRNEAVDELAPLEPIRSKSVGHVLDAPVNSMEDELAKMNLGRIETNATYGEPLEQTETVKTMVSRHDQYHGIGRVDTKDLRQGR